jgi:hypothetical protein
MLAAPGIAWKESEKSTWLHAYKESLYAHGTAHGIDTEYRMECAWNDEHGIQENTGIWV